MGANGVLRLGTRPFSTRWDLIVVVNGNSNSTLHRGRGRYIRVWGPRATRLVLAVRATHPSQSPVSTDYKVVLLKNEFGDIEGRPLHRSVRSLTESILQWTAN